MRNAPRIGAHSKQAKPGRTPALFSFCVRKEAAWNGLLLFDVNGIACLCLLFNKGVFGNFPSHILCGDDRLGFLVPLPVIADQVLQGFCAY